MTERVHALHHEAHTPDTALCLLRHFCQHEYAVQVIALDSNPAQLKEAKPHASITYQQGLAEKTELPDVSVDLITASQALHWLVLFNR